jgi:UDP-N-acetylglucosamine transferase subunit ALG13
MAAGAPFVVVSTGTDKRFPFDRLIDWVESWESTHPGAAEFRIQWGISRPSRLPGAGQYKGEELDGLLRRADAVVVQGGPGGILRSRQHGVKPIVVPRDGRLQEHVDGHQMTFAAWAATRDLVVQALTAEDLHAALDRVLDDRSAYRIEPDEPNTPATVARFAERVERLWSTGR